MEDNLNFVQTDGDSTTANYSEWGVPFLIDTIVNQDSIELVYRQDPNFTYTTLYGVQPEPEIFKVIYSCQKGKWHKSDKIEGEYVSASDESYSF